MEQQLHVQYSQLQQRPDSESEAQNTRSNQDSKQRFNGTIAGSRPYQKPRSTLEISPAASTNLQNRLEEGWVFEILALLLAGLSLVSIIVVLKHYDGRKQPEWHWILLNTLISFLGNVAEFCVMVPVTTGLDQWKWIWFSRKRRPLSHLSAFDAAGRGIIGSVRLLVMQRARYGRAPNSGSQLTANLRSHFAGFACIATILTIAFGPFLQNLIHTSQKLVVDPSIPSVVANTLKYTSAARGDSA